MILKPFCGLVTVVVKKNTLIGSRDISRKNIKTGIIVNDLGRCAKEGRYRCLDKDGNSTHVNGRAYGLGHDRDR